LWWSEFGDCELRDVAAAVPHDVFLLHRLDELERLRCVERRGTEFEFNHARHRQP